MKIQTILNTRALILFAAAVLLTALISVQGTHAAPTTDLSQTINAGTLATDIRNATRVPVASPAVAFTASTFSFDCLSGVSRPSGTFGTNTERVYVDNPGAADDGWTLALAATGGATDSWDNVGATETYDFNDPSGAPAGCADGGGDVDSIAGQLSVDPSVATLNTDCGSCATTNITLGGASAFNEGVTDSITLLNAALASDNIGRWYLTGVDMDQTIPAEQPNDSYTTNMTLTVTAI